VIDKPTSEARLAELVGIFEEGTTGGTLPLSSDDIGDTYAWLQWVQAAGVPPSGAAKEPK